MMKPGLRDSLWMVAGAALLSVILLVVMRVPPDQTPAAQIALKAKKIELVDRIRVALVLASEAEKAAVMAVTDEDSKTFADQALDAEATVREERDLLGKLLEAGGGARQKDLLAQFSRAFAEFERIDRELLPMAVQNTNLKAYRLAFGPAAEALKKMDDAVSHIASQRADSASPHDKKIILLADRALIAALRIQALLPPHIAEESEEKMDEIEAGMRREDQEVRKDLEELGTLPGSKGTQDLATATSRYSEFAELKSKILKLSRENTNVRSLNISLNQKQKARFLCLDALAALREAIEQEPVEHAPVSPR